FIVGFRLLHFALAQERVPLIVQNSRRHAMSTDFSKNSQRLLIFLSRSIEGTLVNENIPSPYQRLPDSILIAGGCIKSSSQVGSYRCSLRVAQPLQCPTLIESQRAAVAADLAEIGREHV